MASVEKNRDIGQAVDGVVDEGVLFENGLPDDVSAASFWTAFTSTSAPWEQREKALRAVRDGFPHLWGEVMALYRDRMRGIVVDEFFDLVADEKRVEALADSYAATGTLSLPFLEKEILPVIADQLFALQSKGRKTYGAPRPVYPPGEVATWDPSTDERCHLISYLQTTAIGQSQMPRECELHWLYHMPHLREFVQKVMRFPPLWTFEYNLGVGANIMKASTEKETALGFHFDSVDSSTDTASEDTAADEETETDKQAQTRLMGATAVIGILDCVRGGERVIFNEVTRPKVSAVRAVLDNFRCACPEKPIEYEGGVLTPSVVTEGVEGVLSIFDGGNRLHAVSSVKEGTRISSVFLYPTEDPTWEKGGASAASAAEFYDAPDYGDV
uniref:Uncharacterized protein n=1 Tax=Chromera velia CCMP2878 TaxID=1169474 RepID=A0A0G4ICX4_9ALVE|eukprot:Cvel_2315.t1-p1 / transcript=Cvel_2315.t1 / gene=Cvel_2315 / organism=Chromera_velia_CCMP2878 / gene_product=hypothetical protein / transcript_product=hypothetical protein / location=Cvel_scaffold89:104675-106076(-) / protein_length=385 / sequence_SO=supercontig / SO=protein_coding / is_pseudo=false